jgi:ubiquinone biosynthesis protein Coq4
MTSNPDSQTLREARQHYFARSGFNEKTYASNWARFQVGPIPLWIPNFASRRRAVRLHDLHHVLTGYETTWLGEAEVSAWEASSGGAPYWTIWMLMIFAMAIGVCIDRAAVCRAYRRGLVSRNLFFKDFDDRMLDVSLGEMRRTLKIGS